ncbi:MAG: hypothetical protein V4598_02015 [Bdellovibrionota bacterium]
MTEIMVAMGLLGGVSLVGMKLMQESASNDTYLRFKGEVAKATALVQSNLSDKNGCRSMLVGKDRGTSISQLTMSNKEGSATVVLLEQGKEYDGFQIPAGGIRIETSRLDSASSRVTDVVITFQIRGRSFAKRVAGQNEQIVKRIPVKTELEVSPPSAFPDRIRSCGAVLADANIEAKKQLCDSLTAGAAIWTGTECRLKKVSCPFGQVPYQLTSMGYVKCIPVDQKLDPTQLFDFAPDGCSAPGAAIQLVPGADGKIKAQCN